MSSNVKQIEADSLRPQWRTGHAASAGVEAELIARDDGHQREDRTAIAQTTREVARKVS